MGPAGPPLSPTRVLLSAGTVSVVYIQLSIPLLQLSVYVSSKNFSATKAACSSACLLKDLWADLKLTSTIIPTVKRLENGRLTEDQPGPATAG